MRCRIFLTALAAMLSSSAIADTCTPSVHVEGKSRDGRYVIRLDVEKSGWKGRLEDTKSGKVTEARMVGDWLHCHFEAFVTDDGSRVVVFEPRVDNRKFANLLIYDGELKILKRFALRELLTEAERSSMRRSISHVEFTSLDKAKRRSSWLEDDGKTFAISLKNGRLARVSLVEPKVIPTPGAVTEASEFEEGPPPGKTDLERFQGRWTITEGLPGLMGVDPDHPNDKPTCTFAGDKVLTPGRPLDGHTFRLDESATPHTIDLFAPGVQEPIKGVYEFRGGTLLIRVPRGPEVPRAGAVDAQVLAGREWIETLQRRKPKTP